MVTQMDFTPKKNNSSPTLVKIQFMLKLVAIVQMWWCAKAIPIYYLAYVYIKHRVGVN